MIIIKRFVVKGNICIGGIFDLVINIHALSTITANKLKIWLKMSLIKAFFPVLVYREFQKSSIYIIVT